jgi:DNA repair exonuclease SbcCD ATPase subunit
MKKSKNENDKLLHELSEKESSARKLSSQFIKYDLSKKDKKNYAKKLKDLKEEKKKMNDYQKLLFINSHFDLLNNELNYEEIKNHDQEKIEHLNKIINLINDEPPFKILIKNLIELDDKAEKIFLEDFEEMTTITGEIDDLKKELAAVKEKIDNFNDIRNKILTLSKEYFQTNLSAEKCPVCNNKIKADELLIVLEDELENNEEIKIKDWKLEKENLEDVISRKDEEVDQLLKKLENNYNEYTNQIYNKKRDLETIVENYKENIKKSKELKRKINDLGLEDRDDIQELVKEKINQYEKEMQFDDLNKLESEIEKAEARLTEFNQFISDYELRLENLDLTKDENINKYYKRVKTKIEEVKFENKIINKAIKKLKVLINYFSNTDLSKQIGELKSKIEIEAKKIKTLENKISELKKLEKEIPVVINDLTEETLNGYKNLANKIYQSINPQPIYNKIDWKRSSAYNKGQLVLNMKSKNDSNSANPSYIYSSAQINVVVLSLFLSFVLKNNWSKLNSVFLDDPIQNMDDINIFSFIDVIRAILLNGNRPEQIFISTHDRDLYNFLLKKFRIFNVLSLEFKSYDIDGPEIERRYFDAKV